MKKILISALFLGFSVLTIQAQKLSDDNVPSSVKEAFKNRFSIAEKVKWELEYDNYEADFTVGKSDFTAVFDKEGKWLLTQTYLKSTDIPKKVKETLTKEFGESSSYKLEDVNKQEAADNTVKYEMDVEKGTRHYLVLISESGELQKKDEQTGNKKEETED